MARETRHAIVGVGVVGEWHTRLMLKGMLDRPSARLIALCDKDPSQPQKALDTNKFAPLPIYTDLVEMIRREKPDIVHVCTPSGDHMTPVITALREGCHVICEKPMEIHLDRIDQMAEASKKYGRRLAGIFQNRWVPANRALFDAAKDGRFGRVAWAGCFTPWYRTDQYYRDGGWRGTWALDGGGAIMNQSVHAVDLLQWVAGPVRRVSAYAASRIHAEIEVEDTLTCSLQFASGAFGTIQGSTAMWPGTSVRLEIGGEHGTAVSDNGLRTYKFKDERPEDKTLLETLGPSASTGGGADPRDVQLERHVANLNHILDAWAADKDADTHPAEARKAVAIILAMYESAKKDGEPVDVK